VNCSTTDGPASFTIRAKVKDKDGAESDPFAQSITVSNVPPTVTGVTAPASVNEGPGTFAFSATGVTDPSSPDVAFGFQYAFVRQRRDLSGYSTTNGSCAARWSAAITVAVKAKDKDTGESTPNEVSHGHQPEADGNWRDGSSSVNGSVVQLRAGNRPFAHRSGDVHLRVFL
jgi:hypothetical protein